VDRFVAKPQNASCSISLFRGLGAKGLWGLITARQKVSAAVGAAALCLLFCGFTVLYWFKSVAYILNMRLCAF